MVKCYHMSYHKKLSKLCFVVETTQVSESTAPIEVVGIATGNWGCGAFGGDPELKCIIQWLAASQVTNLSITLAVCRGT